MDNMDYKTIELIERLHTAATSASDIYERDRDRVITLTRELRAAKARAKRSSARARKLHSEVFNLAKLHNVTSIRYDSADRASRASIG